MPSRWRPGVLALLTVASASSLAGCFDLDCYGNSYETSRPECIRKIMADYWLHPHRINIGFADDPPRVHGNLTLTTREHQSIDVQTVEVRIGGGPQGVSVTVLRFNDQNVRMGPNRSWVVPFEKALPDENSPPPVRFSYGVYVAYHALGLTTSKDVRRVTVHDPCMRTEGNVTRHDNDAFGKRPDCHYEQFYTEGGFTLHYYTNFDWLERSINLPPPQAEEFWAPWCPHCYGLAPSSPEAPTFSTVTFSSPTSTATAWP